MSRASVSIPAPRRSWDRHGRQHARVVARLRNTVAGPICEVTGDIRMRDRKWIVLGQGGAVWIPSTESHRLN